MTCEFCPYLWSDLDENGVPISRPYCHYFFDDGYAPCEVDFIESETEDT